MENNLAVKRISRENWKTSYNKWRWIVILAILRIRFHTFSGYTFLPVIDKCGYCIEHDTNCSMCHLYKKRVCCSIEYLKSGKRKRKNTTFWKYVHAMKKGIGDYTVEIDWRMDVLPWATEMKNTIKKDKPL